MARSVLSINRNHFKVTNELTDAQFAHLSHAAMVAVNNSAPDEFKYMCVQKISPALDNLQLTIDYQVPLMLEQAYATMQPGHLYQFSFRPRNSQATANPSFIYCFTEDSTLSSLLSEINLYLQQVKFVNDFQDIETTMTPMDDTMPIIPARVRSECNAAMYSQEVWWLFKYDQVHETVAQFSELLLEMTGLHYTVGALVFFANFPTLSVMYNGLMHKYAVYDNFLECSTTWKAYASSVVVYVE